MLDLVRLARPHFLIGGVAMFLFGALIARWHGATIQLAVYALGQVAVTAIQLMTHFANDYWDTDTDRLNINRTLFSGGSGILPSGRVSARAALRLAVVCLLVGAGAAGAAWWAGKSVLALALFAVGAAGAWFYSAPPLSLARTGWGELAAAAVVSFVVPAFSYALQLNRLDLSVAVIVLPLVILNWSMIVVFSIPDVDADRAVGKLTFLVRYGARRARLLLGVALVVAFGLLAAQPAAGLPATVRLSLLALPLAVFLLHQVWRGTSFAVLTATAIALTSLTTALAILGLMIH